MRCKVEEGMKGHVGDAKWREAGRGLWEVQS